MFEKEKENSGVGVNKMLDRLKTRVDSGKLKEADAKETIAKVVEGTMEAKKILNDDFFKNAKVEDIKAVSNAWTAWQETGVLSGKLPTQLKNLLSTTDSEISANLKRFARQIWRTEMVSHIVDKVKSSDRKDKAAVVEQVMAAQIVSSSENDPIEALTGAMWLDGSIKGRDVRLALAKEMEAVTETYKVDTLGKIIGSLGVQDIKVVVGGELLVIPLELAAEFVFQHAVFKKEESRVYAQMKNGCRGNLVIIQVGEPVVPPVPPVVPPVPPVVPPVPPVVPPPPEPPKPVPFPIIGDAERDSHIRVDTRSGDLTPSAREFQELIDPDLMSTELIRSYESAGVIAFIQGIDRVPADKQAAVLEKVFSKLNQTDPARARNLTLEILKNKKADLMKALLEGITESINAAPNGSTKAMWEIEKMLVEGDAQSGDPEKLRKIFEKLRSIKPDELQPTELKEMYETQKRYLEFFMKSGLAVDMVETSLAVAQSTFKEPEKLAEMKRKWKVSPAEVKSDLSNFLDRDVEVYLSSSHVLTALSLALRYQYPADVEEGKLKIDNPVQYYYEQLKSGKLTAIKIPNGVQPVSFENPILDAPVTVNAGDQVDFDRLFIDRENEFRLFEQYESGSESLGEHGIWHPEGSAAAFMGEGVGGLGIIGESADIFKSDFFEKGWNLGAVEKIYVAKIKTLIDLKRYDEARTLCINVLKKNLGEPNKPDIDVRKQKLSKDYMTKISAQVRIQIEGSGLSTDSQVVAANIKKLSNPSDTYKTLNEMIADYADNQLEKRAYIELQGEKGEILYDANTTLRGYGAFEKAVFEQFKDLNGYGNFDIAEEKLDVVKDVSKMVTEIILIEAATAGVGGLIAGAVQAGRGAAMAARVASLGTRGLEIGRSGRIAERTYALGERAAAFTRFNRIAGFGPRQVVNYLGEGASWHARGARNIVHSTAFVEAQSSMHDQGLLNPLSEEGAFAIGTTAVTLWGLDKVSKFLRGDLQAAAAVRAGAPTGGWNRLNPLRQIGRASEWVGAQSNRVAAMGGLGYAGISTGEMAMEALALNNLDDVQTWLAVETGLMDRTQAEAAQEPDAWKRYAHTAGVVLGLRTWRHLRTIVPPVAPPPVAPPVLPPLPPKPRMPVDFAAKGLSRNRMEAGKTGVNRGSPVGTIDINGVAVDVKPVMDHTLNGKKLSDHYEDAHNMPKNTSIEQQARDERFMELDRFASERLIATQGHYVEFPSVAEAEKAHVGMAKDMPDRIFRIEVEPSGRAVLANDVIVDNVRIPLVNLKDIQVGGQKFIDLYQNAMKNPDAAARATAVRTLIEGVMQRDAITTGKFMRFGTRAEADALQVAATADFPGRIFEVTPIGTEFFVAEKGTVLPGAPTPTPAPIP
ncbi:hypothetical protein HZA42_02945 [Candidatus Peregrinibacteria bacterium]|nr:hypothetical protein [Candidatus Peregrinibacteria bacterium]